MLHETKQFLESKGIDRAETGFILGTGMNKFLNHVEVITQIPYKDIPHFPTATVEFHKGVLIYGKIGGQKVLVMQGRFHYYEGYTMQQVVYPVRVMKMLGIRQLFMSNAAGGINTEYKRADLILLKDHINLQTANPLTGINMDELGPRFPDMSEPYDKSLRTTILKAAELKGIKIREGVYASVNGPNLETAAEYRYLKIIGADLVGMSTVPEVIAARHMSLPCCAISVVTDECDPDNLKPVNIEEIIEVAGKADTTLCGLWLQTLGLLESEKETLKTAII